MLPKRLQHRPLDHRGYVIPYAQFVDQDGKVQFQVMDDQKITHCLTHRLCGICGEQMGRHIFFVGGDKCVANGYFYDPPMHRECAEYSLQTCPHLARVKGRYAPVPAVTGPGVHLAIGDMVMDKAETFAMMHGERYTFTRVSTGMLLIQAQLPWREVVWFRNGERIEQ